MEKPSLAQFLRTTLYIGTIGYGGPAILAQMKASFVQKHAWVSEREFMDALSLAQIMPGATGVSVIGAIGFKLHRLWGGIIGPLAYITPATVAMVALSGAYFRYGSIAFVQALFAGLGALVVALLVHATRTLGSSVFKDLTRGAWKGIAISILAFIGAYVLKTNVVWLVLASGVIGYAFYAFSGEFEGEKAVVGPPVAATTGAATRDRLTLRDFLPVMFVMILILGALFHPVLREITLTFWGIGIFAFGGGFTTIPLIQHQVVDVLHWLTVPQFVDGIAMGQITPGPVFITATFIGYHVAGILGALAATFAIFTPSLALMLALTDVHAKVKNLRIVKVFVKGCLAGFIGLLASVTLQFAVKSLVSWQAWLIFTLSLLWILVLKKDVIWAVAGTIVLSFLLF